MSRIGEKNKAYGLIIPGEERARQQQQQQQAQLKAKQRPSVFDDDDDTSDSDDGKLFDARKAALDAAAAKAGRLKSATRVDIDKCLAEDPSIFEYDAIYDQISERPATAGVKTVRDRAPKYIGGLMKAAGTRKMEREYQHERKIQAEREAEGEKYADKEAFVTSAYKRRLAEFEDLERQHRLQELKDARQDATKREDLSGFYRNLLDAGRRQPPQDDETPPPPPPSTSSKSGADPRHQHPRPQQHRERQDQHRHRHRQRHRDDRRSRRSRSRSASHSSEDSGGASPPRSTGAVLDPLLLVKLRRRNDADAVSDARQRFLQRKAASAAASATVSTSMAPPIVAESDDDDDSNGAP